MCNQEMGTANGAKQSLCENANHLHCFLSLT